MSALCQLWTFLWERASPRRPGTWRRFRPLWWGGGLQILPFPCVPTLLPWDESGQGCCSETPGNVANPRAPPPLSSHSPACLENPALPVTRAPGTGAGNIPVASTSFRLQGSHLSPGASSWTEVTASLRASYSCSFSNAFSRLQPEG